MWYVIRTISGKEQDVCAWINTFVDKSFYQKCLIPLYEDVWRKDGIGHISFRKMFSGYLFLETDEPEKVYEALKNSTQLTQILSAPLTDEDRLFLPIYKEEEAFLDNILSDGLMRVSYVRMGNSRSFSQVIGPLESYTDYIVKLDLPHRRAIAEIPMLGGEKRIKFGLWLDNDPKIGWIEEAKHDRILAKITAPSLKEENIYGFRIGDQVINITGIYGDLPLEILDIRRNKNSVVVGVHLFGNITRVEMGMKEIEKVE